MKTYLRTSLYSLLITLCLSGCKRCPPDVKLGEVSVKNTAFISYREGQLLTYVNASGNSLILKDTADKIESIPLTQESICSNTPLRGSHYYYDCLNARSLSLKPLKYIPGLYNNYAISIRHEVLNRQGPPADTLFYDSFSAYNRLNGGSVIIITNERGNRAKFPINVISISQQYRLIADTVMNGTTYRDVYASVKNPTLFYSASLGVVAFKDKEEWWYLKQ